jgi:hypothetical protein
MRLKGFLEGKAASFVLYREPLAEFLPVVVLQAGGGYG